MKNYFSTLLLAAILCAPFNAGAQVTIGSDRAPSQWSLLDLCTREQQRALHNARMDSIQRNALVTPASPVNHRDSAQGLMLFNTDTDCLEFWSGTRWVSLCEGDAPDPCEGFGRFSATWCVEDAPTIADLTAKARAAGGRGTVVWYNAATAGSRFTNPNTPLVNGTTYWADNCVDATTARVPVVVTLEPNCAEIDDDAGRIAAFLNVMYDFQHQTLEAFTTQGGEPTSWRWQMRVRVGANVNGIGGELLHDWRDITLPGARTANFTIPANFMYTYAGIPRGTDNQAPNASAISVRGHRTNTVTIEFRCLMTNTNTDGYLEPEFSILFIRTNTSGFGGSGNARFLAINRAPHNNDNSNPNTIRMALLNIGADYNDGIGLGDFYQWGRVADGHQNIDWRKNTHVTRDDTRYRAPFFGSEAWSWGWGDTSAPIHRAHNFDAARYDSNGQLRPGTHGYGRWIILPMGNNNDWSTDLASGRTDLWGNGSMRWSTLNRDTTPVSLDGATPNWSERGRNNNPCRYLGAGWRVPSAAEFGDIHTSDGIQIGSQQNGSVTGTHNTWTWRGMQTNSNAFGGMVITNQNGESVFLPAAGWRNDAIEHSNPGLAGIYLSSTLNLVAYPSVLHFNSNSVNASSAGGIQGSLRSPHSVRCVQ